MQKLSCAFVPSTGLLQAHIPVHATTPAATYSIPPRIAPLLRNIPPRFHISGFRETPALNADVKSWGTSIQCSIHYIV